jgi:16S rRNA (guanine(966)-N(2))-methyltransferase RsmD
VSNPRIIAGKARGIRLNGVPGEITRPITDRVKEALFNIIGADIIDASLFDLFSGTGSVGLEALSRGERFVRFNDLNRPAVTTIKSNIELTRLSQGAEITQRDALEILRKPADYQFDYVYIAPPQYKKLWLSALIAIDQNPAWLSSEAWVIVQIDPVELEPVELTHLVEFDQRRYGSTILLFYERTHPDNAS